MYTVINNIDDFAELVHFQNLLAKKLSFLEFLKIQLSYGAFIKVNMVFDNMQVLLGKIHLCKARSTWTTFLVCNKNLHRQAAHRQMTKVVRAWQIYGNNSYKN